VTPPSDAFEDEDAPCAFSVELPAYLQGELVADRALHVADHVATCRPCQEELDGLRSLFQNLRHLPGDFAPRPELTERVLARVATVVLSPFRSLGPSGLAFLGMVAAAILLGLFVRGVDGRQSADPGLPGGDFAPPDVDAAAAWLASVQDLDGGWTPSRYGGDDRYQVGLTGLVIAALVSRADAPGVSEALDRGAAFLIRQQDPAGRIGRGGEEDLYNHAPGVLALLSLERRFMLGLWDSAADRGLAYLRRHQGPEGGFGYRAGGRPNAMISAWPLEAFLIARDGGIRGLDAPINAARRWYGSLVDGEGRLGYDRIGALPYGAATLTAVGMRFGVSPRIPEDRFLAAEAVRNNLLTLYYLAGCRLTQDAQDQVTRALAALQVRSGEQAGSFRPEDPWAATGGRLYSTALAMLIVDRCAARDF
jgi:hypothetical protein